LNGAIVWFVDERACISEIPEPCQIDASSTLDVNVVQSAGDVWGLTPISCDSVIDREESVVGFVAFDTPPRQRSRWNHRSRMMAAVVVGIAIALGGSWTTHDKRVALQSIAIADLVSPTERAPNNGVIIRPSGPSTIVRPTESTTIVSPVRSAGDRVPAANRAAEMPVRPPQLDHTREAAVTAAPPEVSATSPAVGAPTPLAAISAPILMVEPSFGFGPSGPDTTVRSPKPEMEDRLLVNQTLQRYRVAYDDLDARSAQAIWPSVNQIALARAFGALESQTLRFDACDVQMQTIETATATCRGSARYVTKIGNRDPHTESRVWSFNLRKRGTDWMIDQAHVAR
jgi:hypothetical protein